MCLVAYFAGIVFLRCLHNTPWHGEFAKYVPSPSRIFRPLSSRASLLHARSSIYEAARCITLSTLFYYIIKINIRLSFGRVTTKREGAWQFHIPRTHIRRIKIKYIQWRTFRTRGTERDYSLVHATKRRWESRWRVQLAPVMPAADVPAFFYIYILEWFASWSGIYWLPPRPFSCITPLPR